MLSQITTTSELLKHVPELAKLFHSLDGAWEPGATIDEFLERLLSIYQNDGAIFISWNSDINQFDYVITFQVDNFGYGFLAYLYVGKHFRSNTRKLFDELRDFARVRGVKKARWLSANLTSSYRRWAAKQTAIPTAIMYETEI
jgi:GNAT superfamily N-acetyltransferase